MSKDFISTAHLLSTENQPYAMAMVVRREAPSSGKPGDKAIIKINGEVLGWIGGGCTRGIIIKEAQNAIKEGKPRLVRISPNHTLSDDQNVKTYNMTCHSGGSVEVYVEPVLPKPHILIIGNNSHVGMALAKIAKAMDYLVTVVSSSLDPVAYLSADYQIADLEQLQSAIIPNSFIVVSTQGENDERSLVAALRTDTPYIAFVASRRKANAVFHYLHDQGISFEQLATIKTPAGLNINAKTPEEVAISILAEIISIYRSETYTDAVKHNNTNAALNDDLYINPVCGIPVQKSAAKHILEYEGEKVYFCCDGCKVSFEQAPERYMNKSSELVNQ